MGMELGLKAKEVIETLLETMSLEALVNIIHDEKDGQVYSDILEQTIKA